MSDQIRDVLTTGLRYEHVQHTDCRGACVHVAELMCTANHLAERLEGWRPPARQIETAAELEALPAEAIICLLYGTAAQKAGDVWEFPNVVGQFLGESFDLPVTVLWTPDDYDEEPTE